MSEATEPVAAGPREIPLVCVSRVLALDEEQRSVRHVVSTARLDRSNRIVDPGGWRLANFREAPRVLADHNYEIGSVIGRATDTRVEGDALVSTTIFDREGLGNVAFRLVQSGMVNSWSVGWIGVNQHALGDKEGCTACEAAMKRVKYGTHYTAQDLLEYSLVAIPANPDAVMGLQKAGLVEANEAEEWIESFAPEALARSEKFYSTLSVVRRNFARHAGIVRASRALRRKE